MARSTRGGALITYKDPLNLQVLRDSGDDIEHSLLLTGSSKRVLWSQNRPRTPKRYKAIMKQVVGGAFCGFFSKDVEEDLINAVIGESTSIKDDIPATQRAVLLDQSLDRLVERLKPYLSARIETYIDSISTRLLDPQTELRWNFRTNNCQTFCDSLIDRDLFGSLFAPLPVMTDGAPANASPPAPVYLMSFVCRPGAYARRKVQSKYDVPNGLTEEYLLKFRYGRHDESDIIDVLAEYWYDWGAFDRPIYRLQHLFPWDCTEAYNRYPVKCGDCNLSKHVWAFPFDSWSIISLHLARPRQFYPRSDGPVDGHGVMSDADWFQNRLTVLLAQDVLLAAAAAMARCKEFHESTLWLCRQGEACLDRLKLGGIHRAQPFSHHFERGAYHQYFVAEWTHLTEPLKIKAYEKLRDGRARLRDVGSSSPDDSRGDGDCGADDFGCGGMAGSCAGGCQSGCGGQCGSGCVGGGGGCAGDGGGCAGGGGGCAGCGAD